MKKITHLLALLLFCALTKTYALTGDSSPAQTNQAILESVKTELASFLENIPVNLEKEHGFNDRAEFAKAVPASIYRIVGVDENGKAFQTNLYNVVIAVNGEYRSMLSVSQTDGKYEIETVGGALMAKELQAFEKNNPSSADQEKIVVNVYTRAASFVSNRDIHTSVENTELIPLESAKSGLSNASVSRAQKSSYTLSEAVAALQLN